MLKRNATVSETGAMASTCARQSSHDPAENVRSVRLTPRRGVFTEKFATPPVPVA